ncbi:unnamed protein product [Darwinula stevensoni]|uniref:Uncharacterized protein n=1 Tax=Darwinula stevensoni TaxID=69355 RepID=A0A7R8X6W5_9CRUS|nr:unnamed protein product [Darwinula stevensoni]CAG0886199.1 unnamed protein product [Darwinula stevensoni]
MYGVYKDKKIFAMNGGRGHRKVNPQGNARFPWSEVKEDRPFIPSVNHTDSGLTRIAPVSVRIIKVVLQIDLPRRYLKKMQETVLKEESIVSKFKADEPKEEIYDPHKVEPNYMVARLPDMPNINFEEEEIDNNGNDDHGEESSLEIDECEEPHLKSITNGSVSNNTLFENSDKSFRNPSHVCKTCEHVFNSSSHEVIESQVECGGCTAASRPDIPKYNLGKSCGGFRKSGTVKKALVKQRKASEHDFQSKVAIASTSEKDSHEAMDHLAVESLGKQENDQYSRACRVRPDASTRPRDNANCSEITDEKLSLESLQSSSHSKLCSMSEIGSPPCHLAPKRKRGEIQMSDVM